MDMRKVLHDSYTDTPRTLYPLLQPFYHYFDRRRLGDLDGCSTSIDMLVPAASSADLFLYKRFGLVVSSAEELPVRMCLDKPGSSMELEGAVVVWCESLFPGDGGSMDEEE